MNINFKAAYLALICLDRELSITECNQAATNLLGEDCSRGANLFSIARLNSVCKVLVDWLSSSQATLLTEVPLDTGTILEMQCWLSEDNQQVQGYFRDTTTSAKERVRQQLLITAVEQAWESVCITDSDLDSPGPRFVYCNRGYEQLMGFEPEEVYGFEPENPSGKANR
ncbi:hypothetical protein BH10CYA1_BH10CYA1_48570 [soil metagenome]